MVFLEGGKILAMASSDGRICFLDSERGDLIHIFAASNAYLEGLGFTKDRRLFATGRRDGWIEVWGPMGTFESLTPEDDQTWASDFALTSGQAISPDGRWIVKDGLDFLAIHDAATGAIHAELRHPRFLKSKSLIAFSPDGKTLATVSNEEPVRLWQLSTGEELFALAPTPDFHFTDLRFSHDSRSIAVTGVRKGDQKNCVFVWHADKGTQGK
jgi:WD40 repeat protein